MPKQYSIAEARQNLAAIVHELDTQTTIELTRRGTPVAILISLDSYRQLQAERPSFWELYTAFRASVDPHILQDESETYENVRDRSPGREIEL